jgi:hypothetical protein
MNNFNDQLKFATKHPECVKSLDIEFKPTALPHLVHSSLWPNSVNSNLIVGEKDTQKKIIRATSIIRSFITVEMKDRKFLDFGSGDATCKKAAVEANAAIAIAYDLNKNDGVSTSWTGVKESGPFNIVLLYDVIDHMVNAKGELLDVDGIIEVMKEIKGSCTPDCKLYIRCHPWTSRHGTHCYLKSNKAYSHYLSPEYDCLPTIKITAPIATYEHIFKSAGYKVIKKQPIEQPVEPIFQTTAFKDFIKHFSKRNAWMYQKVMSFTFIDFELTPAHKWNFEC